MQNHAVETSECVRKKWGWSISLKDVRDTLKNQNGIPDLHMLVVRKYINARIDLILYLVNELRLLIEVVVGRPQFIG